MALFIDSLAIMLIGVGSGTFLGALYFFYSAMGKFEWIRDQLVVPAVGIGIFDFMSGYEISFTWPLPAGYNMLFGDPLLFFGILLVVGAIMTYKKMKVSSLSFLSVILGIYVIMGAYGIFTYKLESGNNLIGSMALYLADGIAALLAPMLIIEPKGVGKVLYYIEFVVLTLGTIVALYMGYTALTSHLVDFSKYFPSLISMVL